MATKTVQTWIIHYQCKAKEAYEDRNWRAGHWYDAIAHFLIAVS